MKNRCAVPVAVATTALLMLAACSDDEPTSTGDEGTATTSAGGTTLAEGDVTFAEDSGLDGQTMDISAVEEDGQVTGEAQFSFGLVLDLQCANTSTDLVIVGGEVTAEDGDSAEPGDRVAVLILEGDPDSAGVWYELPLPKGEVAAGSCQEFVDSIADDQSTGVGPLSDIAEGDDIETG